MCEESDMELLEVLGTGGYATVHLCRRKGAEVALFALKRIPLEKLSTPVQQERACTEQHILTALHSPYLCRGYALSSPQLREPIRPQEDGDGSGDGSDRGFCSLAMEFIDGKPLYQCIWKYRDGTGRLPESVAQFFAAQLVVAVRALHASGFVHRDLKSGNVLVDQRGFAKVIDFGFAKALATSDERTHSFCGTHYIMAPEIFTRRSYGFAVDWWSLGVVVYEMVAGRPPWPYKPPVGAPLDAYFASVTALATALQTESPTNDAVRWSPELQSLLRGLLTLCPESRLGFNGAAEVMAHPWFHGVDWELLEAKDTRAHEIAVPYDLARDFVDAVVPVAPATATLADDFSSAESIDAEDNAKYFADF